MNFPCIDQRISKNEYCSYFSNAMKLSFELSSEAVDLNDKLRIILRGGNLTQNIDLGSLKLNIRYRKTLNLETLCGVFTVFLNEYLNQKLEPLTALYYGVSNVCARKGHKTRTDTSI
jgi:hypothetical protein